MDDLISRKWLMECVEEGWIKFDTQEDENRFVHLIRDIAPSAQQWIPISEGLPEMTDTYLVQVGVNENGEGMHTEARTAEWNAVWQKWYVHTTRCLVGDIIKWMPIPWEGEEHDTHRTMLPKKSMR